MSTKAKAAGDGDDGGRKKAKLGVLSGCDIKTEELFNENFGPYGYRIEDESNLVMSEWNNPAGHAKIKPWLVSCGPYFASLIDKIKRNSETSLYPLLVNALVPIMEFARLKPLSIPSKVWPSTRRRRSLNLSVISHAQARSLNPSAQRLKHWERSTPPTLPKYSNSSCSWRRLSKAVNSRTRDELS